MLHHLTRGQASLTSLISAFFAPLGWRFVFLAASCSTSPEALAGQLHPPLPPSQCPWMAPGGQAGAVRVESCGE